MSELVNRSGVLVCLEFPLYKNREELGPPWPLQGVYWDLLAKGGDGRDIEHHETSPGSTEGPFVRVDHFKPSRSYPNGKGTDMMSIWRRSTAAARST